MFKISERPENHCITDYTKAQKNRSSILVRYPSIGQ